MLHDEPLPHELAQNPVEALLRNAQDAEQLADRHLRMAADKMHDPVMRPPEAVLREDRVGLGGKVAIREKQQLDALANRLVARFPAARLRVRRSRLFMSAMLTYFAMSGTVPDGLGDIKLPTISVATEISARKAPMADSVLPFDDRDGFIWYDGRLVPWRDAKLHVLTHGLHYASCVFEGERVYNGKVFRMEDHNERLINSAKILGFEVPASMDDLARATLEVVAGNKIVDGYVRPIAWRGAEQMGVSAQASKIHLALACWDWPAYFSPEARAKGIRMLWSRWARPAPNTAPTQAKASGLYMICTMAKHEAEAQGCDDALMLDWRGQLAEGTGANIFLAINGELHTPTPDCFLNGITRQTVIGLAQAPRHQGRRARDHARGAGDRPTRSS